MLFASYSWTSAINPFFLSPAPRPERHPQPPCSEPFPEPPSFTSIPYRPHSAARESPESRVWPRDISPRKLISSGLAGDVSPVPALFAHIIPCLFDSHMSRLRLLALPLRPVLGNPAGSSPLGSLLGRHGAGEGWGAGTVLRAPSALPFS